MASHQSSNHTTSTTASNTNTTTTTTTTTNVTFGRRNRAQTDHNASSAARHSGSLLDIPEQSSQSLTPQTSQEPFPAFQQQPISRTTSRVLQPSTTNVSTSASTSNPRPRRRPIGIKRLSSTEVNTVATGGTGHAELSEGAITGRRRSASLPLRAGNYGGQTDGSVLRQTSTRESNLPAVVEGEVSQPPEQPSNRPQRSGSNRLRNVSDAAKSAVHRLSGSHEQPHDERNDEYENDVVDLLDVLDPEVAALTTLTNVQNSLFVPDLGRWLNRRPTFQLSREPSMISQRERQKNPELERILSRKPLPPTPGAAGQISRQSTRLDIPSDIEEEPPSRVRSGSVASIASHIKEERFAVLPHGISLNGWTEEEIEMLDDHVRHMLHSRRSRFKRSMRAFGKYVSKPLGFLVTLYAFLITAFGLAWVLFLIGWIYVGERQSYLIHVVDLVLVALFAVVGDGMAPFRAVDTYHMIFIAHYHRLSWRLRKQQNLPKLQDHNDLPEQIQKEADLEALDLAGNEYSVLTPEQQKKLIHHQSKFSKSHSFYKPHETGTHYAFPLKLLIAIVCLLDAHSCFQIALGAVTWGTNYKTRPNAVTPVILSCSITVNILAGILIKVGDKKTRKKDILEKMYRQQLTEEAMKKVEKRCEREKEADRKQDQRLKEEWENKHSADVSENESNGSGSRVHVT